jgi:hypothetical protein
MPNFSRGPFAQNQELLVFKFARGSFGSSKKSLVIAIFLALDMKASGLIM